MTRPVTHRPITRDEARDMADAHDEGYHDEVSREGCPVCEGRELRSYPQPSARITKNGQ